jgi:hypothetical protein
MEAKCKTESKTSRVHFFLTRWVEFCDGARFHHSAVEHGMLHIETRVSKNTGLVAVGNTREDR